MIKRRWNWIITRRLFWSICLWVGIAAGAFTLLGWMWGPERPGRWHSIWVSARADVDPLDRVRVVLTTIGGIGAVGYLVIKYRERSSAERAEADTRLLSAVQQLGSDSMQVRIAGVYALADVADTYKGGYKQRVVDILCGYLRTERGTWSPHNREEAPEEGRTAGARYIAQDRAVESTILDVLAQHLRKNDAQQATLVKDSIAINRHVSDDQLWCDCDIDLHGAVITEDFNFDHVTLNGTADFRGTTFEGKFKFSQTTSQTNISFQDSHFFQEVFFDRTVFHGGARFISTAFLEPVTFKDCRFNGNTSFERSTFEKSAGFSESIFDKRVNFSESKFNGDTGFVSTVFNGYARFVRSSFSGSVYFDGKIGCTYKASSGTTHSHITLTGSTFNGRANFNESIFNGRTGFMRCTFKEYASFLQSKFKAEVRFSYSTFNEAVDFEKSVFNGEISFDCVYFDSYSRFANSTFMKKSDFHATQFGGKVDFTDTIFWKEILFSGTVFKDKANFRGSAFSGEVDFSESSWFGDAIFWGSDFRGSVSFSNSVFDRPTCFNGVVFAQGVNFHGVLSGNNITFQAIDVTEEKKKTRILIIMNSDPRYRRIATFNRAQRDNITFPEGMELDSATHLPPGAQWADFDEDGNVILDTIDPQPPEPSSPDTSDDGNPESVP